MSTLLVVGGSGFIGREICRLAVRDGHDVRSVSRGGRPATDAPWVDSVSWTSADLFRPNAWRDRLVDVDAVIHAVGTMDETPASGVTFERLNGDSAIITALEAERAGVETYVFLSAAVAPPRTRHAYLTAKRRAEAAIADLAFAQVTLRPGPVYGADRSHGSRLLNAGLRLADSASPIADRLGESRPLPVETVARAAYRATIDPGRRFSMSKTFGNSVSETPVRVHCETIRARCEPIRVHYASDHYCALAISSEMKKPKYAGIPASMNMYNTHRGEAENTKSYSTDTIVTQTTANARSCIIPVRFP